jgi:hypothetical protein
MVQNHASSAEVKGSVRTREAKLGMWLGRGAAGMGRGVLPGRQNENI